jgi:hypothetical protein
MNPKQVSISHPGLEPKRPQVNPKDPTTQVWSGASQERDGDDPSNQVPETPITVLRVFFKAQLPLKKCFLKLKKPKNEMNGWAPPKP